MNRCAHLLALRPGDPVRVRRGVLIGHRGRLLELDPLDDDDARATVVIELFGCRVMARLGRSMLEPDPEEEPFIGLG